MIVTTLDNTVLFYHPETGKYNIKTYIPHKELDADVMFDREGDFELSKWYHNKDGKIYSAIGMVE